MHKNMMWGVIVIIVGLVFLLDNMGVIGGPVFDYVWPLIIIAVGVQLILRENYQKKCGYCAQEGCPLCKGKKCGNCKAENCPECQK